MPKGTQKLPKTLALCADRLYTLKADKAAAQRVLDEIETEAVAIRAHLIDNLPKSEATGITGKTCRATLVTKLVPQVEDWDALHEYIRKGKRWELLQKRVSTTSIVELWENGKTVPGVVPFQTVSISLNKVS